MKKINLALILISAAVAVYLYPQLPAQIPMHWNIQGQVDNYMPKQIAVWVIPGLSALMFLLFQVLPKIDPKKDKYSLFKKEWDIIQTAFISFFTYLNLIVLYISLNPGANMIPLMFIGLGVLFILLGNFLSKIRQNYFIGIKVPWTLASEDNWNKTHRFASWTFVIAGFITLLESYFLWQTPVVVLGSLILASILPIVYSFLLYKKSTDKMKYVYIALLLVIMGLIFTRGISGEDSWICQNGQWAKHGNPANPPPSSFCP